MPHPFQNRSRLTKKLFYFLIGMLGCIPSYADCSETGLSIFPRGSVIRQNSIFILEAFSESQYVITGLNTANPIYLQSGKKKVRLLVTELLKGEYLLSQAILKPESELEAGLEYTLIIDNLLEPERVSSHFAQGTLFPKTYKVIAGMDITMPHLTGKPKILKKTYTHFGCGPSTYVVFSNPATDTTELMIRTTVKSIKTGRETTFYIQPGSDWISVGHDMCSGPFKFDSGNHYLVKFSFMDTSGNHTQWKGESIAFTRPTPTRVTKKIVETEQ